uniref:Uncharacterized protein n=1 Tax=Rhizophora mucronata TaxID=61149 RepID=A0A2P2NW55_RHIMU
MIKFDSQKQYPCESRSRVSPVPILWERKTLLFEKIDRKSSHNLSFAFLVTHQPSIKQTMWKPM